MAGLIGYRPRPRVGRRLVLAAVGLLVAAWIGLAGPAAAHTDLLTGSPGPAQRAGGTVSAVDLVVPERVTEFELRLEAPDGSFLPGSLSTDEGQLFRFSLDQPITETGRYIVRYTMISADGDFTETGYFFTYEPDAPQPLPLGEPDVPQTGNSIVAIVAGLVFVGCVVGLALVFLLGLERRRAAAAATTEVSVDGDEDRPVGSGTS
ncbi:MAG: copper resistance protein CopC [Actinomycetota bacterium]